MDLHKIHHPDNFDFICSVRGGSGGRGRRRRRARAGRARAEVSTTHLGEDVFRLDFVGAGAGPNRTVVPLLEDFRGKGTYTCKLTARGGFRLASSRRGGLPSLTGTPGATLGLCGAAWMVRLEGRTSDRFFGQGEKWGPLEKSGRKSLFWTTDVWADVAPEAIGRADVDCTYAVVPYLIIEREGVFFGILIDSPYPSFMATNPSLSLSGEDPFAADDEPGGGFPTSGGQLYFGSQEGPGIVYFLVGPSLRALMEKLQRLVGKTPRPALWALGHHQCRWGYRDHQDLLQLDEAFCRYRIPTCGLWLDIDYMDGYRVFTTAPGAFPLRRVGSEKGRSKAVAEPFDFESLWSHGRNVVPILDPGVKVEPGYWVHDAGVAGGHFCLSPSGRPYVGIVWPGRTYFPDFSQQKTRRFWAGAVSELAQRGFSGFWVDMNDPSTGPIENRSMLFQKGRAPHEAVHNQYGLLMALSTMVGLEQADPRGRPFVLSRSGFTGISRCAALWTGDNVSSFRHLAASIPISINLALSGIPMNGPDVPGFGGDADAELAIRFYQATFLFPFLRNHSVRSSARQEPWAFDEGTTRIIGHFIRLRYRFLPYLYQLFIAQEKSGTPILAPLFIDEGESGDLERASDQFFLGRLLLAPIVERTQSRRILLPPGHYYCLRSGRFCSSGNVPAQVPLEETPLFVRSETVLPLTREEAVLADDGGVLPAASRLRLIDLHVFVRDGEEASLFYLWDDGATKAYRRGAEGRLALQVRRRGATFDVHVEAERPRRVEPGEFALVIHGCAQPLVFLDGQRLQGARHTTRFSGATLSLFRTETFAA